MAVIPLFWGSFGSFSIPKIPRELLIVMVPPFPLKALALMSLFSLGIATMNLPLMVMLPPLPGAKLVPVPAFVEILLRLRSNSKSCRFRVMSPPVLLRVSVEIVPLSRVREPAASSILPPIPSPWLLAEIVAPSRTIKVLVGSMMILPPLPVESSVVLANIPVSEPERVILSFTLRMILPAED